MDHHYGDGTPYALQPRCAVCRSASGLLHCGGCKVASYCGRDHQSAHRSKHKAACNAIQKTQQTLEREEAALRANTDDFFNPGDAFITGVGQFWGILHTRDYMRARFAAADALLKVNSKRAVEKALDHFTDMLRLCRSDNLGVRDFIPGLLLRLGREQECYDFIKWFSTVDGHYDWGDNTLPYLDIRDVDVCEPVDKLRSGASLSHLVMLTLLKLSLRLDLDAYETASGDPDRPLGTLARSKLRTFGMRRIAATIETLTDQYNTLCQAVHEANPYVWDALVDQGAGDPTLPPTYTMGSLEEAHVVLYQCKRAWEESEDAILMIESDTCSLVPAYQSPAATIADGGGASPINPDPRPAKLERMRGVGKAFPSLFNTTLPAPSPIELFPATHTGGGGRVRFVSRNDARAVLVYADGACLNNGQPDPRAGWAVMCSPTGGASGRLENRGPFGDYGVATSNRAELRAAIAALRLCDWTAEGFNNIVIATDSSYVVEGATGWAKGWVRNGWKTRTGGDVKNRDLWELLLGEVERWEARGFRVALWRIPRALNADADHRAKEAAEGGAEAEFRDAVIRDS